MWMKGMSQNVTSLKQGLINEKVVTEMVTTGYVNEEGGCRVLLIYRTYLKGFSSSRSSVRGVLMTSSG